MVSDIDLALHVNTDAGEKDFGVKGEYAFGMIPVGGINLRKPGRYAPRSQAFLCAKGGS
jgi:hypothetical protein